MKWLQWHKRPSTLAIVFCLALTAALSANPLLAAVSAFAGCERRCCCCERAVDESAAAISSPAGMKAGCCSPPGTSTCHMSAASRPAPLDALIHTTQESPVSPITLLLSTNNSAGVPQAYQAPTFWIDTGPDVSPLPLYLKTCRIIC